MWLASRVLELDDDNLGDPLRDLIHSEDALQILHIAYFHGKGKFLDELDDSYVGEYPSGRTSRIHP